MVLLTPSGALHSELLYQICQFLSQLLLKRCEVCCGEHVWSRFCWSCRCCCCRGAVLGLGVLRAFPLVTSLNDAPLPCQKQLCFVARLEPTRMCWTRETNAQECNSGESACNPTARQRESMVLLPQRMLLTGATCAPRPTYHRDGNFVLQLCSGQNHPIMRDKLLEKKAAT